MLVTPGCNTTPKLPKEINAFRIIAGRFRPNVSISVPINGDRNSSMDAQTADRIDRILTALACGEREDDEGGESSSRWRVIDGSGENTTIDVDATIRKDV